MHLILDTLEVYEFYHMALMMCKRYKLSGRQGKYLVLMCSKYSNLNNNRIFFSKMIASSDKLFNQRVCSLLAHEAIHNVICLLEPEFLKMKPYGEALDEENSLGIDTYRMILSLGFWKKLVYTMQSQMSLHLCMKFSDFINFYYIL